MTSRRWLRQPAFYVGGAAGLCLGALVGFFFVCDFASTPSRPGPSVDRSVGVGDELLGRLRADFVRSSQRAPSRDELADMLLTHVSEEILHREALTLGLERQDAVVRRRLIEKMSALVLGAERPALPTARDLERHHELHGHRFVRPAQMSFEQVFLDTRARGASVNDAAKALLAGLRGSARGARPAGDPSPVAERFADVSEGQVMQLFGEGFAQSVAAVPMGSWQGPLSSKLGMHLVRVTARARQVVPPLAEIEKQVRADWLTERHRGSVQAASRLLPSYRIDLSPGVRAAVNGAALARPLLERSR